MAENGAIPDQLIVTRLEALTQEEYDGLCMTLGEKGLEYTPVFYEDAPAEKGLDALLPDIDPAIISRLSPLLVIEPEEDGGVTDYPVLSQDFGVFVPDPIPGKKRSSHGARMYNELCRHTDMKVSFDGDGLIRQGISYNGLCQYIRRNGLLDIPCIGPDSEDIILQTVAAKRLQIAAAQAVGAWNS